MNLAVYAALIVFFIAGFTWGHILYGRPSYEREPGVSTRMLVYVGVAVVANFIARSL